MLDTKIKSPPENPALEAGKTDIAPILVVEDDLITRKSLRYLLESWGYRVYEAEDGYKGLEALASREISLVLSDIDMPNLNGFEFLKRSGTAYPDIQVIMISSTEDERVIDRLLADGAAGYALKPFRLPELKSQIINTLKLRGNRTAPDLKTLLDHHRLIDGMPASVREFTRLFIVTSELHHVETGSHIRRIGKYSELLARLIGMPALFARDLAEAAILHDIGKLVIPDVILKKPGPLTLQEIEIMKTHPLLGAKILSRGEDPLLKLAHSVALYHHERWDGSGYPHGLKGEEAPIAARIVAIVDVFDALHEKRVYKDAWPRKKILNYFREKKGLSFEARLTEALLANYSAFEKIRETEPD